MWAFDTKIPNISNMKMYVTAKVVKGIVVVELIKYSSYHI